MRKNRVQFIDISRGIAVLLMIVGHVLENNIIKDIIFSFHMPLFILVSGYFYKNKFIKEELKNSFNNLILPSIVVIFLLSFIKNIATLGFFDTIWNSLKMILMGYSHENKMIYSVPGIGALWFIYMLVIIKLLFIINKKITKGNELLLLGLILLQTYIGYILGNMGLWLPWSLDVSLACMLFYYIGYIIQKKDILNRILSNRKLLCIMLSIWIISLGFNCLEIAMRRYPGGLWSYLVAICGSMIVLKLSSIMESKMKYTSKLLAWCGLNSLWILICHYIEASIFTYDFNITNNNLNIVIVIFLKCFFVITLTFIIANIKNRIKKTREI